MNTWLYGLFSFWLLFGLYLDGWAHQHLSESLDTFFTPWHGVLYSGFFALALFLTTPAIRAVFRGEGVLNSFLHNAPISVLGVVLFFMGGVGDMIWHVLLGIESGVDALLSPTHLILAIGASMMITDPFHKGSLTSGRPVLALLSLGFFWSLLTFFTMYVHPVVNADMYSLYDGDAMYKEAALGLGSFIVQVVMLSGILLYARVAIRSIPSYAFTKLFTLVGLGMSVLAQDGYEFGFALSSLFAGIVADMFFASRVSQAHYGVKGAFWFAFLPAAYTGFFLGTLALEGRVGWPPSLWSGVIIVSAIIGFMMYSLQERSYAR